MATTNTRQVSAARRLHQRRILRATRGIAALAVAATAIFAAAAAHTTRHASAATSSRTAGAVDDQGVVESGDDGSGSWTLTPSQSSPSQSFGPPVARSGGS
jgi:hypothetical protein